MVGGGAFSLPPAASRQVTVRLTPTSLGSKVATLSFASDDTDENPKNVPLSGTGVAPSDLVVSTLTGPATAGAGFAITLNETTGNIGPGPAGATSTRYYLSSDTSIGAGDVLLGSRSFAGLAPGGSSAGTTNVTIPAGTANGSYFIIARADDLNQAFESNEGNNTRALAIRIGPDLRVTPIVFRSATLPAVSSGSTFRTFTFSGFPDTTGTILDATAVGNSVKFTVNVATAGKYDIKLSFKQFNTRGVSQFSINGANVGAPLDQYRPTEAYAIVDYGNFTFPTTGNYSFKFTIVGKNANSTSFGVSFDDFTLTPQ